jgi:FecR protein
MAFVSTIPNDHDSFFALNPPGSAPGPSHSDSILVPDAELLFRGDFKRAGPDLVLTDQQGRHHLIAGYFSSEHSPALVAPNGATLPGDLVELLAGSPTPLQYAQAQPTDHPGAIGTVEKVVGDVTVVRNGVAIALHVGDSVYRSDIIQSGDGSSVGIDFPDGTALNLVANTRMAMSEFSYDPNSSSNSALFSLVEGTFSFVAGKVAHSGDMKIATPVATMGIRGTTGWVEEQVATITATVGNVAYSFAVANDFGVSSHGLYDLFDQNGDVIATVSQTGYLTFVTPQGPGLPPVVTVQPMTNTEVAYEQQILEQVFQSLNLMTVNPHSNPDGGSSTPPDELNNPQLLLLDNNNHTVAVNVPVNGDTGSGTVSGTATIVLPAPLTVIQPPTLSFGTPVGVEGSPVALNLNTQASSGDRLTSLIISALPIAAILSDGAGHSFTATNGSTAVDVVGWNLSSLTVTPPNNLNITLGISATQQDGAGDLSTATATTETITVDPLAPSVHPVTASGNIDTPIALNLGVQVNALGGESNTLASLLVNGIPVGATLSDGHGDTFTASAGDTSVDIHAWNLSSLTLDTSETGTISLNVTAVEESAQGNLSAPTSATETVKVPSNWVGDTLQESFLYPNLQTTYYTSPTFTPPASGVLGDPDFGGALTLAVSAAAITVTFLINGIWSSASFNGVEVADISGDPLISSVTIDPSTTVFGLTSGDISFDSNAVWIDFAGIVSNVGSVIKLDVTFDPPLDPSQVSVAQTLDGSHGSALNAGSLSVVDGTELALVGTVDNTGIINVDGATAATAIGIDGTVTLEGGGHLNLSSSTENYIFGSTLINVDNTISGGGDIGNGSMTFHNAGVVEATGSSALIIDTGDNAFVNTGIIEANSGTLLVDSAVTGGGTAVIHGGTLEFSASSTNNVLFSGTSSGMLVLDQSAEFTGHISGFSSNDQIDLSDLGFSLKSSFTYSAGDLTITDGSKSVSLLLEGNYSSSSFALSTDGHGGTLISDPASTPTVSATVTPEDSSSTAQSSSDQILPANFQLAANTPLSENNSGNNSVSVGGHGNDAFVFSSAHETPVENSPDASPPALGQTGDPHAAQHLALLELSHEYAALPADVAHNDPIGSNDAAQFHAVIQSAVHLH